MYDQTPLNKRVFRAILSLVNVVVGSSAILIAILFLQDGNTITLWVVSAVIATLMVQFVLGRGKRSRRLLMQSIILRIFAITLTVIPYVVLLCLFYYLNSGNVSLVIQIAGDSFLGMFLLMNLVNGGTRSEHLGSRT
jgi:hypothetical protein